MLELIQEPISQCVYYLGNQKVTTTIPSLTLSEVKGHIQARSKVEASNINYVNDGYLTV